MRTVLDNGLTVVLQENHASNVAALQLWVNVGSADEGPDEAGLAHLHEHMLFKGTSRRGPGEIAQSVESSGGEINAWTSFDQTVYHLVVPGDSFAEGLDVLADAVTASVFDPTELEREIEVVVEEIRRSEDTPARRLSRNLFAGAYTIHPYRLPVIGTEQSVRSFTRDKILSFYRRHYTPANMTFVAVGAFDEKDVLSQVQNAFRGVEPREAPRRRRPSEPPQRAIRAGLVHGPVKEAYLSVGWHIGNVKSEDVAAIDLLALLLGQGNSSRLVQEVKRSRGLVNDIHASAYTPLDPGLLIVSASLPAQTMPEALRELLVQAYRFRNAEVSPEELERAKRMLESDAIYQRETVQGQARKLGFFETMAGHVDEEERYWERVAQATATDIRDAAVRYLRTETMTLSAIASEEDAEKLELDGKRLAEVAKATDGELEQEPKTRSEYRPYTRMTHAASVGGASSIHRHELSDGTRLVVMEDHSVPLISMRAAWSGGLRMESPETNGIHQLLARSLTRGTRRRSAIDVAREIDELAGGLHGSTGRNSFGLQGEFLAADADRAFDLFFDVLLDPTFPHDEIARERELQLEEIRSRDDSPASTAFQLFSSTLYDTHPYRMDPLGTAETVSAATPDALTNWLATHYALDGLTLVVVGDITGERARELVERHLENTRMPRSLRLPKVLPESPLTGPREVVRNLDRKQAHLVVGFRGLTVDSADRYPLEVLSAVLSGQGGRLFMELRDKRSLAYSVSSVLGLGLDPGYFGVYIGTSPEKVPEAKDGIRSELMRVRDEPITDEELDRARKHLAGTHDISLQRLGSRAAVMALDETYGLGAESHKDYGRKIRAVTAKDVQRVCRELIDFDRSVTALVTPES